MVIIRLARGGSKKRPHYSVRVADSRESRDGRFLEKVGYFNPMARGQEKRLELKMDRIESWITTGAKPSERVQRLIKDWQLGEEAVAEKKAKKTDKIRRRREQARDAKKREALQSVQQSEAAE